jgi:peroxiredoxin
LVLFFNVECLGCIGRALPFAQTLAERYPGLPVLAVHSVFRPGAPHDLERIRELVAHHGLTFPVLLDDGSATFDAYTAEGTPHWVLIDGEGRVRKSIFGSMDGARQRLDYALLELFGE